MTSRLMRDIRDEIEQTVKELVASIKIRQISSFNVLSTFTLGLTGPNCSFR
jgi:hypothetical protein